MIVFAREAFQQAYPDVARLQHEHWAALARNRDTIPLDIDLGFYVALENAGRLLCVTARDEGVLVGYAAYILRHHPRYRTVLFAAADVFWITPAARKPVVGKRLFEAVERELRALGVRVMTTSFKVDAPNARGLLEHLNHELVEEVWQKVLD